MLTKEQALEIIWSLQRKQAHLKADLRNATNPQTANDIRASIRANRNGERGLRAANNAIRHHNFLGSRTNENFVYGSPEETIKDRNRWQPLDRNLI